MEALLRGEPKPGRGRELGALRKELAQREAAALSSLLSSASVVAATLTTAGPDGPLKALKGRGFDVAVIDECAQGMEIACWIPMLQAKKAIVAGDHCQLPPTILSEEAAEKGLSRTLMGRTEKELAERKEEFLRLLSVQYRMNSLIMDWASKEMYSGKLVAAEKVKDHKLGGLLPDSTEGAEDLDDVILFLDTQGCDMPEILCEDDESKGNPGEVKLAYLHLQKLISSGIRIEDIAVISPYNLQVQLLRKHLHPSFPGLAIRSVDGFQGQEKEAVVLSLVRSNTQGQVGFLKDHRRVNVAVTRARRHLTIIGDGATICKDKFAKSLIDYVEKVGSVRSAAEFKDALDDLPFEIDTSDMLLVIPPPAEKKKQQKESGTVEPKSKTKKKGPKPTPLESTQNQRKNIPLGSASASSASKIFEEDDDVWKDELKQQILDFVAGPDETISFPPDLENYQRKFIHEQAESLELKHYSTGDGKERRIIVEKAAATKNLAEGDSAAQGEMEEEMKTKPQDLVKLTKAEKKKSRPKKACKPSEKPETLPENVDEFLDRAAYQATRCQYSGCKTAITVLGQKCPYCIQTFCLSHAQAEIHGCGHAAKVAERRKAQAKAQGIGGGRRMGEGERGVLERKLQKKIGDLGSNRSRKDGGAKK